LGEAREPIGKRGVCHSLARRDMDSMRVVEEMTLYRAPQGLTGGHCKKQDVVRRTGKKIYG
jgi:hypothetical protein